MPHVNGSELPTALPELAARFQPLPGLYCAIAALHDCGSDALSALEADLLQPRSERRLQQSLAVRALARRLIADCGWDAAAPIGVAAQGWPQFPPPLSGSLSHSTLAAAAAVARRSDWIAVGIDIEPQQALPEGVAELVGNPAEWRQVAQLPGGVQRWGRALFGIKECFYKCMNPITGLWIEFDEVEVSLDASGTARLRPRSAAARQALTMRYDAKFGCAGNHVYATLGLRAE